MLAVLSVAMVPTMGLCRVMTLASWIHEILLVMNYSTYTIVKLAMLEGVATAL